MADALRPFGDLIAIGKPNVLPNPGAARIYASDEEWMDVVKRQMQTAQIVVIRAGSGAKRYLGTDAGYQTSESDYELFRTSTNSVLPVTQKSKIQYGSEMPVCDGQFSTFF